MLIEIGMLQVLSENKEEFLKAVQIFISVQRCKREEMLYKEARFYTKIDDEDSIEHWMYIDFFENPEDCQRHWNLVEKDNELKAPLETVMSKIVPDSFKTSRWIEKDELRLE
ncbi:MAG: hypothetical protein ACFFEF_15565 [Candidatus Thorarchaeota archaeon]